MKIKDSRSDRIFSLINGFILFVIFFVIVYPLVYVLSASVSEPRAVNSGKMVLLPVGFTAEGYKAVFAFSDIWRGYANTLFYTFAGTTLNLFVTLPCAYALSRPDFWGRNFFMTLFVITMYFGGGMIPAYLNIKELGLLNTYWVMIIPGLISVYNLIVARTFFASSIPVALQEAAMIDGSSDFRTFLTIVMPLSQAIIVVLALYYGVGHWNAYFNAMIYLSDRAKYPLQLILREILVENQMDAANIMLTDDPLAVASAYKAQERADLLKYAIIVVATVPMLLLYPSLQKFFEKGVMIGAVKG